MKTVGIIAEFNPFHKGHEYLIRTLKKETGSDYAVIVMSGDYTQRGAPAILDKYTRTKMALMCGADLVLELPIYYSTSSAEFFAQGAISILNGLNCIDFLGFGSESGSTDYMKKVAGILVNEPKEFSVLIKKNIKKGMNYPAARSAALSDHLGKESDTFSLLTNPNDILGIEYIKALILQHSTIEPYTIKRVGAGYDDVNLGSDSEYYASAKAIRAVLENVKCDKSATAVSLSQEDALSRLPLAACEYLLELDKSGKLTYTSLDDFSELLHYKLLLGKNEGFSDYLDVTEDFSDKIIGNLNSFSSFSDFIMKLKSKDITYTRISRSLLHILLGMTTKNLELYTADRSAFSAYARILGFNKNASPLMKKIKECSCIPVISTLSDAYKALDKASYMLLSETISASNIYDLVQGHTSINEYAKPPVII
ncbi:nucleotidyltransferase [Butyrivibrio sp. JL13D10]|uniref:nucleotidyltransferase n=1 Tax=Butyrivibrio sp. JL13D10 TaxID=3236815 RepID=UPI0038B4DC35